MSSQSNSLVFDATSYLTGPANGNESAALVANLLSTSRCEEQPQQSDSRDDNRVENEHGPRPHLEIPPGTSLEDLERAAVEKALQVHHGNRTHAAKTLGISVRTLQRKLKAWHVPALALR